MGVSSLILSISVIILHVPGWAFLSLDLRNFLLWFLLKVFSKLWWGTLLYLLCGNYSKVWSFNGIYELPSPPFLYIYYWSLPYDPISLSCLLPPQYSIFSMICSVSEDFHCVFFLNLTYWTFYFQLHFFLQQFSLLLSL